MNLDLIAQIKDYQSFIDMYNAGAGDEKRFYGEKPLMI